MSTCQIKPYLVCLLGGHYLIGKYARTYARRPIPARYVSRSHLRRLSPAWHGSLDRVLRPPKKRCFNGHIRNGSHFRPIYTRRPFSLSNPYTCVGELFSVIFPYPVSPYCRFKHGLSELSDNHLPASTPFTRIFFKPLVSTPFGYRHNINSGAPGLFVIFVKGDMPLRKRI